MSIFVFTDDDGKTICSVVIGFVRGHYVSNDRVLLDSLQSILVLLCNILLTSLLCISGHANSFIECKCTNSFDIGNCSLHHTESFLGFPHARAENAEVVDLVLLDLSHVVVPERATYITVRGHQ